VILVEESEGLGDGGAAQRVTEEALRDLVQRLAQPLQVLPGRVAQEY
jgi:hypothetical protein